MALVKASNHNIFMDLLCDANKKYFFTYPFWSHGIRLIQSEEQEETYMDEAAVRARAGIIHIIAWSTLMCSFLVPEYMVIIYIGPLIVYDMLMGVVFGLTPFCPIG